LATALAVAVLPLILVGAGVTSKGAGMAFPDWPTSNDHLLNPPGWLQDDHKLWEHGHRLIGWLVGMLAIAVTVWAWRVRGWVRLAAVFTLTAIVIQGVLGGLRVTEVSTGLAMIHGIWGQLCFCLACVTALISSPSWSAATRSAMATAGAVFFRRCAAITTVCVFVQLVSGAVLRHFGFGWALAAHLIWACVVILLLSFIALWALERYGEVRMFARLGRGLVALTGVQLFLGGAAFLVTVLGSGWPAVVEWAAPSAHVVVGAMLLACTAVLTLCSFRVLRPSAAAPEAATALVTP
jgi:cytochrome c oxidase assembly protein subunit 15